jgi:hypothetical protein
MISKQLRDKRRRSKLWARYRKLRAEHATVSASCLLAWARTPAAPALEFDRNGNAELRRDGFDIRISYEVDTDADLSYLGEFKGERGAEGWRIDPDNVPGDWHTRRGWRQDDRGAMCFYVPCNSIAGARRDLRNLGYSKHAADCLARFYAHRDAERLARYWRGDLAQYVVSVRCFKRGIELASDSLGGIDVDREEELGAIVRDHDMIGNALAGARIALASLCPC